jgi:hypothetical protein
MGYGVYYLKGVVMAKQYNTSNLNVKDVPCKHCIHCRSFQGVEGSECCMRLGMPCTSARNICVKSAWYAEMCTADALIEASINENRI